MKEILDKYVKNSEKEILRETEVDIFVREFKEKLNFIWKVEVIDHWDEKIIKTRNWLIKDELGAFYEYKINENILELSYIETVNSPLDTDYSFRSVSDNLALIPWFWKYIVIDSILLAKNKWLDSIKFIHILEETEDFYKKLLKFVSENKLIESVIYEKYTDDIWEIRKNIIIRL